MPAFHGRLAPAKKGIEMRLFALTVAICALSQTALGQTPDCKSIADPRLRLGCYDRAAPPPAPAEKTVAAKPAAPPLAKAPVTKLDNSKYVDTISAEDALMNAKLKNICRGC
jgi:hypothetical protein